MQPENSAKTNEKEFMLVLIRNIPPFYHSRHLRLFFSTLVERKAFSCYHFRHRPESLEMTTGDNTQDSQSLKSKAGKTLCCFVKVFTEFITELFQLYNGKNWLNENGEISASKCHIIRLKLSDEISNGSDASLSKYSTRLEKRIENRYHILHQNLTESTLNGLIEMKPPPLMPQGNVGTPTSHFLNLINNCQMPTKLIGQLGLHFPKGRKNRKYGNVPFHYDKESTSYQDSFTEEDRTQDMPVHEPSTVTSNSLIWFEKRDNEDHSDDDLDNDECEEWERHEALNDDVTTHERTKQALFEDEMEVVWEKGGPGIVWHMDANVFKAQNGGDDLDEANDDWDIDMALYYGDESEGQGDKDARDSMQIRREKLMKVGKDESIFEKTPGTVGKFERHTKGIGRKVLEKHGWKEGKGVGKWKEGISEALSGDGQLPYSRKGFGYYGEVLRRKHAKKSDIELSALNRQALLEPGNNAIQITTTYDKHDEGDSLKRRKPSNNMSYRSDL